MAARVPDGASRSMFSAVFIATWRKLERQRRFAQLQLQMTRWPRFENRTDLELGQLLPEIQMHPTRNPCSVRVTDLLLRT